jgi:hypothetical protein
MGASWAHGTALAGARRVGASGALLVPCAIGLPHEPVIVFFSMPAKSRMNRAEKKPSWTIRRDPGSMDRRRAGVPSRHQDVGRLDGERRRHARTRASLARRSRTLLPIEDASRLPAVFAQKTVLAARSSITTRKKREGSSGAEAWRRASKSAWFDSALRGLDRSNLRMIARVSAPSLMTPTRRLPRSLRLLRAGPPTTWSCDECGGLPGDVKVLRSG